MRAAILIGCAVLATAGAVVALWWPERGYRVDRRPKRLDGKLVRTGRYIR